MSLTLYTVVLTDDRSACTQRQTEYRIVLMHGLRASFGEQIGQEANRRGILERARLPKSGPYHGGIAVRNIGYDLGVLDC